jgi:hypothetical protein
MALERNTMSEVDLERALFRIIDSFQKRRAEKGWGAAVNLHEIHGIMAQEHRELEDALHTRNIEEVVNELTDVAVGALFSLSSIFCYLQEDLEVFKQLYSIRVFPSNFYQEITTLNGR